MQVKELTAGADSSLLSLYSNWTAEDLRMLAVSPPRCLKRDRSGAATSLGGPCQVQFMLDGNAGRQIRLTLKLTQAWSFSPALPLSRLPLSPWLAMLNSLATDTAED